MEQCSYIQPEAMEGANLQPIREIIEAGMRGEKNQSRCTQTVGTVIAEVSLTSGEQTGVRIMYRSTKPERQSTE